MRLRSAGWLVVAVLALAACGGTVAPSPSAEASLRPVLSLEDLDARPIDNQEESVALAFDRDAAAALLHEVPETVDFERHAVVCVFLGPRQTTGWSVDLRGASLTGRELRIVARESAPRAAARPQVTYPADCGLLTRAALPVGELAVRADDTSTDEFIAGTVAQVPELSPTP